MLIKKKYLLKRTDLELNWRPLYEAYYFWEESSASIRYMVKAHNTFKNNLKNVIKHSRSYFSDSSTAEMLEEWRPMLCPCDRSMNQAMKYFSLFLPTACEIPPEKSYKVKVIILQILKIRLNCVFS